MAPMDQHRQNFFWKYNVFQHKTNEQTNKKNVKNRQRNKVRIIKENPSRKSPESSPLPFWPLSEQSFRTTKGDNK